jgi:hypothetical protein
VVAAAALLVWAIAAACSGNDLGQCCTAPDPTVLPKPDTTDAGSVVSENLAFNCESASCVSYQGSTPYCTQACISDSSCPSGFTCAQVLHAMPPPTDGGTMASMKYCVQQGLMQCNK